jgi:hypothetical protein
METVFGPDPPTNIRSRLIPPPGTAIAANQRNADITSKWSGLTAASASGGIICRCCSAGACFRPEQLDEKQLHCGRRTGVSLPLLVFAPYEGS